MVQNSGGALTVEAMKVALAQVVISALKGGP